MSRFGNRVITRHWCAISVPSPCSKVPPRKEPRSQASRCPVPGHFIARFRTVWQRESWSDASGMDIDVLQLDAMPVND